MSTRQVGSGAGGLGTATMNVSIRVTGTNYGSTVKSQPIIENQNAMLEERVFDLGAATEQTVAVPSGAGWAQIFVASDANTEAVYVKHASGVPAAAAGLFTIEVPMILEVTGMTNIYLYSTLAVADVIVRFY